MTRSVPNLGPAEMDILRVIWERGPSTAREIREAMERTRPLAHASVATILKRLHQKGLVQFRKADRGKAFLYEAQRTPEHVWSSAVQKFVRHIFDGDAVSLVSSLIECEPLTAEQVQALRSLLDRLDTNRGNPARKRSQS